MQIADLVDHWAGPGATCAMPDLGNPRHLGRAEHNVCFRHVASARELPDGDQKHGEAAGGLRRTQRAFASLLPSMGPSDSVTTTPSRASSGTLSQ